MQPDNEQIDYCNICCTIEDEEVIHEAPECENTRNHLLNKIKEEFKKWYTSICDSPSADWYMQNKYDQDKNTVDSIQSARNNNNSPQNNNNSNRKKQISKFLWTSDKGQRFCQELMAKGECSNESTCNKGHPKLCYKFENDSTCDNTDCRYVHRYAKDPKVNCNDQEESRNQTPQNDRDNNFDSSDTNKSEVADIGISDNTPTDKCFWNCQQALKHESWSCEKFQILKLTLIDFWRKIQIQNPKFANAHKQDYDVMYVYLTKKKLKSDEVIETNINPGITHNIHTSPFDFQEFSSSEQFQQKPDEPEPGKRWSTYQHPSYYINNSPITQHEHA